jgi:hypothetical protein
MRPIVVDCERSRSLRVSDCIASMFLCAMVA